MSEVGSVQGRNPPDAARKTSPKAFSELSDGAAGDSTSMRKAVSSPASLTHRGKPLILGREPQRRESVIRKQRALVQAGAFLSLHSLIPAN